MGIGNIMGLQGLVFVLLALAYQLLILYLVFRGVMALERGARAHQSLAEAVGRIAARDAGGGGGPRTLT